MTIYIVGTSYHFHWCLFKFARVGYGKTFMELSQNVIFPCSKMMSRHTLQRPWACFFLSCKEYIKITSVNILYASFLVSYHVISRVAMCLKEAIVFPNCHRSFFSLIWFVQTCNLSRLVFRVFERKVISHWLKVNICRKEWKVFSHWGVEGAQEFGWL